MNAAPSILKRVTILSAVAVLAITAGTFVPGDTFAGSSSFTSTNLDLKIDSKAWYNGATVPGATWSLKNLVPGADKFFNFSDIKPGDFGKEVVSIHPSKSTSWLCLDFSNFTNKDGSGVGTGDLGAGMQFFAWFDTNDDGVFQPPGEKPLFGAATSSRSALQTIDDTSYAIADSTHGPACSDGGTKYVGIAWCAGALGVNLTTGAFTCNGATLGNAAQTDSISLDVSIRAMPSTQDAKFTCATTTSGGGGNIGDGNGGKGDDDNKGGKSDDGKGGNIGDDWHQASNGGFNLFGWNPFGSHKS